MEKFEKPSILENKDVQNADQSTLNTKQELMSALEDEITNKGLAKELKVSHKRITRIAEKYIESNPEYLVWRKDTMGRGKWHYSRDLSNIIREQLSKEKIEAPEASPGEITTYALSKELNTTFQRVDKIAKEYQESHPEYFIWRRDTQGRRTWHYTQIFADILRTRIKQEDIENPEAEQGEITNSALAKELGRSPDTIQKIVDEYKESHPEYFVYRKDKKNNIYLHYTREFTDIIRARIRKEYLETPEAEQGEIINKALAEEVGRSPQTIQRLAHEYKESHPEYFVWRRDKGGNGRWHYSVILADIIRERVKQEDMEIPYAGSGEIPNTVLAEELKVTQQAIQKIADEYKESHLEYFVWRRDVMGKKFIYYTPEFADIRACTYTAKKT